MKNKKNYLYFAFFLACCSLLIIFVYISPIRPVVTIKNSTSKYVYIYSGESIYGIEPEPEEVERIVKSKPELLAPGKEIKLIASFSTLIKNDATIDIEWRVGGQYEYNSTGGGVQNYFLSSMEGGCFASIDIQDGFNNAVFSDYPGWLCLKKLKRFRYKY